jgi:hypothetical protein
MNPYATIGQIRLDQVHCTLDNKEVMDRLASLHSFGQLTVSNLAIGVKEVFSIAVGAILGTRTRTYPARRILLDGLKINSRNASEKVVPIGRKTTHKQCALEDRQTHHGMSYIECGTAYLQLRLCHY